MELDAADRESVVVVELVYWHRIPHIVHKDLAFLCANCHLEGLRRLETDAGDFLIRENRSE